MNIDTTVLLGYAMTYLFVGLYLNQNLLVYLQQLKLFVINYHNAHQKSDDPQRSYYLSQKKTLEINPRHPLMKELLRRVENDPEDLAAAKDMVMMLFRTATLRSGYMLRETADFALSIEHMMRKTLGVPLDEVPDEDDDFGPADLDADTADNADEEAAEEDHDEL